MKRLNICIMLLAILLITGCQQQKETIRIGVNDWPPCEVWYVALEQELFEDVNVELIRFSTWSDNMNALYLGNIDITHSTYFNNIFYSEKGEWGQMIAPIDTITGSDGLVISNDLEDVTDLVNKKIAVEVGTDEHYLLYKALEMYDIPIESVQIISASSAKTAELFINDEVDAIFTYEPYLSKAANEGEGKIVFTTKDLPGQMVDVLVGSKEGIDSVPKAYVEVLKGYYKAREFIQENEVYEVMALNESMDVDSFKGFYNSFTFYDAKQALEIIESNEYIDIHHSMSAFILQNKLSTTVRPIDELITVDILKGVIDDEE